MSTPVAANRRLTGSELAKELGISQSTVSRALSGDPRVHPRTRARVVAVARERNYVPNSTARYLAHGRVGTLGVLVDTDSTSSGWTINRIVPEIAWACSRAQLNMSLNHVSAIHNRLETGLHPNRVDGVIVVGVRDPKSVCDALDDAELPYVLLGCSHGPAHAAHVRTEDEEGMHQVVHYLYDLGHRHIAFFERTPSPNAGRAKGYRDALSDLGISTSDEWAIQDANPIAEFARLYSGAVRPTAVACSNDGDAALLLHWCLSNGIDVPTELSIVGYGDLEPDSTSSPALTTVRVPVRELAKEAVETLVKAVVKRERPSALKKLSVQLTVRETTSAPQAS